MPKVILDQQILEAALTVITEQGYAGATTRDIAAAAGINEVTLFRRFGSKQKLLMAVVEQEAEKFVAAGIKYTGDVETDLLRIIQFYRDLMQHRGRVIAMLINELPRQPELLEIMQIPMIVVGKVSTVLEAYQRDGILINESPLQAFTALVGPLFLHGILGVIPSDFGTMALDPHQLVTHFLKGRAHPSSLKQES